MCIEMRYDDVPQDEKVGESVRMSAAISSSGVSNK